MGDLEKINRSLELATRLSAQDAVAKARDVVTGMSAYRLTRAHIVSEWNDGFTVEIRPTTPIGWLTKDTSFIVAAERTVDGADLTVQAESYATYQEKMLWFIPFGPKVVPGAAMYIKVLDAIETALKGS